MSRFCIILICFIFWPDLSGQEVIRTMNNLNVDLLVKDVFVKGNCRNVRNIESIGDEVLSIGQFTNGADVLGFEDGIILSTGNISLAQGPNNSNDVGFAFNVVSDDPDLSQLATNIIYDATGLEFDFVPINDLVTFRYVFASEEYCEFVDSDFNDVFGFFVSGPGINGEFSNNAINVATLGTSGEDVSINTINHIRNQDFYVNNVTNLDAESCMINFNALFEDFIEYDGFTRPLTASFRVTPCETYHIKLIIGDIGDPNLDSAVFLQTNSFDLGDAIDVFAEVPGSEEAISYEGCIDGQFVFTRSTFTNINQDQTVEFMISADSEATNGVDFLPIPLSITIPANETTFTLPISIIEDAVIEGPENLKLELMYECDCIDPSISELIINEQEELIVSFNDIETCADQAFMIAPEIVGGVPPFEFLWSTGSMNDTIEISIQESTQLELIVTDLCGSTSMGIANILLQSIPSASIHGTYDFCENALTGIPVQLEGNPPWTLDYQIDGLDQPTIVNITDNPFYLPITKEGQYNLIAFSDIFCQGNVVGSALIESTFLVEADVIHPSCLNSFDGSIVVKELDAVSPFTVEWNVETENNLVLEGLAEDIYLLSITDANDCLFEKAFTLEPLIFDDSDCSPIYIPNIFSPDGDGNNDVFSIYFNEDSGIENILSFQIYDRWGNLVFDRNNFKPNEISGWDGRLNGNLLNPGVFVYKIDVAFSDESTKLISGDITLIR